MALLGRKADAIDLVRKELEKRPDFPQQVADYLVILNVTREWPEIVRYYDSKWDSPDAFRRQFSRSPPFAAVIPALQAAGHADAPAMMALWRKHLDTLEASGFQDTSIDIANANWHLLKGEPDKAADLLETAYSKGARDIFILVSPILEDTPRLNAIRAKIGKAINAERAKLGLKPIEMPKPYP